MNRIYLAITVLLLIPALSFAYLFYTESKCNELADIIENAVENPDYSEKRELFERAKEEWGKIETVLALSVNHLLIDHINESFTKAEAWQRLGEDNMFITELKWLGKLVNHVSETEKPTVYNIF